MAPEELELFVHTQGEKPRVIVAAPGDVLGDVLVRLEILKPGQNDLLVFVGECEEALQEPLETDDGKDEHTPVDIALTVAVLDLERHRHIHVHRCRHVAVSVNFNGNTRRRKFSPATTVGVAAQWARRKFRLDPAAAAEYVLQLCNSTDRPRPDKHLGELTAAPVCSLCFDLVKEVTPQG